MDSMFDLVSEHIKQAMRDKDKDRLEALRMLKSKLLENKTSKKPIAEPDVVIQYCKKLKDSQELYPVDSEQRKKIDVELAHLAEYMPKQLSEDQVKQMIGAIVEAEPESNFGAVMKLLSPQIKGQFDGKRATELVKQMLDS